MAIELVASATGLSEVCISILAALLLIAFELRHITAGVCCPCTLKKCTPEALALVFLALVAIGLRVRGPTGPPLDDEAWQQIVAEWPLLLTADTLLAVQTMLRFLVFTSAAFRSGSESRMRALSVESGAFFLGAIGVRVWLFAFDDSYHLDGPLGGVLAWCFEAASLLPLMTLVLCAQSWTCKGFVMCTVMTALCGLIGSSNTFKLAGGTVADGAFTFAHCMEFVAAIAHIQCAGYGPAGLSRGIVTLGLTVQQVLSAYYFLEAFDAGPELVSVGKPYAVIAGGSVIQLGMYLFAGAAHVASVSDDDARSGGQASHEEVPLSTIIF